MHRRHSVNHRKEMADRRVAAAVMSDAISGPRGDLLGELRRLNDELPCFRMEAIRQLESMAADPATMKGAIQGLLAASTDPDELVRKRAMKSLESVKSASGFGRAVVLELSKQEWTVQKALARA